VHEQTKAQVVNVYTGGSKKVTFSDGREARIEEEDEGKPEAFGFGRAAA
jgi:hypothetical protein